jgi:CheY-like chemotaxis protein
MFESFSQEHLFPNHSRQAQGTGLGLAICDRLCRLMGGSIQVDSRLGQGTTFKVTLPLLHTGGAEDRHSEPSHSATEADFRSYNILVAEDNRINQRVLELLLNKLQQQAEFVATGRDAVDRVLRGGIDIVFMDLQMPELDGLEATRVLRRSDIAQPYIIALTAFAFGGHENDCMEAGMNDFLNKPVRGPELKSALDRFETWRMTTSTPRPSTVQARP